MGGLRARSATTAGSVLAASGAEGGRFRHQRFVGDRRFFGFGAVGYPHYPYYNPCHDPAPIIVR